MNEPIIYNIKSDSNDTNAVDISVINYCRSNEIYDTGINLVTIVCLVD